MRPIEYYKDREQTYLKHFFLERYLETVAYHIGFSQREFVYVDCFSGPWRAADEELGDTSIRIALDRLNAVRSGLAQQKRYPTIRAIFVEKSAAAFSSLQQLLKDHSGSVKTVALLGGFEDNLQNIVRQVGGSFGFVFVDPTGWTGFAMENLGPVLKNLRGEVMVNFMFDFINRFLNFRSAANEDSLDRCFGTDRWRTIRDAEDRESALVKLYVDQVRAAGNFDYATFTRILKPLHERAYFHLVYATRSGKGIEKFRDVEKKVAAEQELVRDRAQREYREAKSGQPEFDFFAQPTSATLSEERLAQLAKAEARVWEVLDRGPVPFESLQPRVLEIPLVWKSDLTEILIKELRAGRIVIDGLSPRARIPKTGCTIRRALAT